MEFHPDVPVRSGLAGVSRRFSARAQARASALPRNTGRANSLFHRYGWRSSNETAGASRMSVIRLSNGRILFSVGGVVYAERFDALQAYKALYGGE